MSDGVKYDNGKKAWGLVPFKSVEVIIDALMYGAKKYAPDNWKKVPDAENRYFDALMRHATAYKNGETHDPESGVHHLGCAGASLLFLIHFAVVSKPVADRASFATTTGNPLLPYVDPNLKFDR